MKVFLTVAFFFGFLGVKSQGISDLFSLENLFQVDLDSYADPKFQWPSNGATQAAFNDALTELKDGSVERSVLLFEAAFQKDSSYWPIRYYYAVSLRQTAQYNKASWHLRHLLIVQQRELPEIHLEYGRLLQQGRQLDKAKDQFQEAIKLDPKFSQGYYALGIAHAVNGDLGRARKNLDRCVELDPKSAEALFGLGMIKLLTTRKAKNFDLSLIDQSLQADSSFRPAFFWRGFIEADKGNFQATLRDWGRLIQMSPGNPFMLNMRGFLYIEMEKYEDAYADFRKAILMTRASDSRYLTGRTPIDKSVDLQNALNYINQKGYGLKEQSFLHLRKGFCMMVVGRKDDALAGLNESLRIERSAAGYLLKAIHFERLYMEDSAQHNYVMSLRYDNDLFDAHKKRAIYFVALNDWKNTYAEFNQMKRINPESLVTYRISGLIKLQFKDYLGCIIDLTRVLKEDTTDAQAWNARGLCRSNIKDFTGARQDLKNSIRLSPKNRSYAFSLVYMELGAGDTIASRNELQKITDAYPKDCELLLIRSDFDLGLGVYGDALYTAELVLKNLETGLCTYSFITRIHALRNKGLALKYALQHEKALESLSEAIRYSPESDLLHERAILLIDMDRVRDARSDLKKLRERGYAPAQPYIEKYLN